MVGLSGLLDNTDALDTRLQDGMNDEELREREDELFDESAGYEDDTGIQLSTDLSFRERKQATLIYRLFNELWGLCIIRGDPGSGKDTFLNWMLYTCKRFFPNKRILRDERPRKLFGNYDGLFNEESLRTDLEQMRHVAKGVGANQVDQILDQAADKWANSERAKVLLQDSVVGVTEFWDWVYSRSPHKPINKTMGGVLKLKRHFNTLILGCVQLESDLDKKTCKPFIDWRVTCTRSQIDTTRYTFLLNKVKYDRRKDIIVTLGSPFAIPVDAGKPLSYIGDGRIVIKNAAYKPVTPNEIIVMEAIKSGLDKYEDLVDFLEDAGDIPERDVLKTLKELCLKLPGRKPKFAIWYPCIYHLFNSRSAPNLRTTIKKVSD